MIVVVASSKGGVGKTTTSVSLAASLANLYPTTLMDFDAQGQVAFSFGQPVNSGVYNWLVAEQAITRCLVAGRPDNLKLLPGDSGIWAIERLFGKKEDFDRLVNHLQRACWALPRLGSEPNGEGYVVIDTAAGGLLQQAALAVADQVVIPFRPEAAGVDGVYQSLEIVKQLAPNAKITVLPAAFDARLREHRGNVEELEVELTTAFGDNLGCDVEAAIPARIAVAEAVAVGKTIWEHENKALLPVRLAYSHLLARVLQLAAMVEGQEA